jgi:hypothetical protein
MNLDFKLNYFDLDCPLVFPKNLNYLSLTLTKAKYLPFLKLPQKIKHIFINFDVELANHEIIENYIFFENFFKDLEKLTNLKNLRFHGSKIMHANFANFKAIQKISLFDNYCQRT